LLVLLLKITKMNSDVDCIISYAGRPPPLILISLDGFRPDYFNRGLTPTIKKLADCGVNAPYMKSVYPTFGFVNAYTIVTVYSITVSKVTVTEFL